MNLRHAAALALAGLYTIAAFVNGCSLTPTPIHSTVLKPDGSTCVTEGWSFVGSGSKTTDCTNPDGSHNVSEERTRSFFIIP